jgi:hypothetical protein
VPPGRIIPEARKAASHPTSHKRHGDTRLATAPDRPTRRVSQSPEASQPALVDVHGTEGHLGRLVRDDAMLKAECRYLPGVGAAAVQGSEDALVHPHEGEPDRGDCLRGRAPHVQKPEASRNDPAAATVIDDLPAPTIGADH